MFLTELFEASELVVRPGKPNLKTAKAAQADIPGARKLGSGAYGTAFAVPGDLETVTKIAQLSNDDWAEDGYYAYVETLRKLSRAAKSNPYLPQIFKARRYEAANGKPYLEVSMEKLTPFKALTADQARSVLEKLAESHYPNNYLKGLYKGWKNALASVLARYFYWKGTPSSVVIGDYHRFGPEGPYSEGGKEFKLLDPQFHQAAKMIKILGTQFSIDMHKGNIMFRMTPTGPQMVFSDPLSWSKH